MKAVDRLALIMPDVLEEEKVVIRGNRQRLVTERTKVLESTHPYVIVRYCRMLVFFVSLLAVFPCLILEDSLIQ